MKKIGILTFHRAFNYGAQVQSYALVTYLKKNYPNVQFEIIDYQSVAEKKYYFKSIIRNALKVSFSAAKKEFIRNRCFSNFSKTLPLSDYRVVTDDAVCLFKKIDKKYDAVIVGSDAIFNWNLRKFPVPFYLNYDLNCLKISYAASAHALKYNSATPEEIEYCRVALNNFDYLGVRDSHTEQFAQFCGCKSKTFHNCDPSLLLDMNDIDYPKIQKILTDNGIDIDKPLILVMTADAKIIKPIFEQYKNKCQFASLYLTNPLIKKHISNLSPLEWAGVFKFAKITVTEYFHGTLLSLKNNTPVISVDRTDISKGYTGKIRDVLNDRLQLNDMFFSYSDIDTPQYAEKALRTVENALQNTYESKIINAINIERENSKSFDDFLKEKLFN